MLKTIYPHFSSDFEQIIPVGKVTKEEKLLEEQLFSTEIPTLLPENIHEMLKQL
jgi:hypothetical protein